MKAIVLISGGLDSILAARIIKEQAIDIIPLNFKIPFCHIKRYSDQGRDLSSFVKISLGEELKRVDIGSEFLKLLLKPRHGFGSNMNPCIDCKILMLLKSKELMLELGAQFIATGEVLGQRPMSQHKQALKTIEQKSGLEGLLLRPLCAKNLIPTIPEEKGWINRDKLLGFSGRSRRPQIKLAQELNISGYPNASGGCLLTDREFSIRLKDLIAHEELCLENIELLKLGRHFRLSSDAKLVVGRDERENEELKLKAERGDYLFMPNENLAGPICLGRGNFNQEAILLSARIACRYCDLGKSGINIIYRQALKQDNLSLNVFPLEDEELAGLRI
jgi:tRNA U34 2-thiouridine synthase MnmA/TrmU